MSETQSFFNRLFFGPNKPIKIVKNIKGIKQEKKESKDKPVPTPYRVEAPAPKTPIPDQKKMPPSSSSLDRGRFNDKFYQELSMMKNYHQPETRLSGNFLPIIRKVEPNSVLKTTITPGSAEAFFTSKLIIKVYNKKTNKKTYVFLTIPTIKQCSQLCYENIKDKFSSELFEEARDLDLNPMKHMGGELFLEIENPHDSPVEVHFGFFGAATSSIKSSLGLSY